MAELVNRLVSRPPALTLMQPRKHYRPAGILQRGGFRVIEARALMSVERLPAETAIGHVRSMALWREVPPSLHAAIDAAVRDYVATRIDDSECIARPIMTTIVSGRRRWE